MQIKFNVKQPNIKFKKNDIVELKNTKNNKSMFVRIEKIVYLGTWFSCEECNSMFGNINNITYGVSIQKNSWSDKENSLPLRPGMGISYKRDILEKFDVVNWTDDVIKIDDKFVINQRQADWRSYLSEFQKKKEL